MKVRGTVVGSSLLGEGYTHDSNGDAIRSGVVYDYLAERYAEVLVLWPTRTPEPDQSKRPTKKGPRPDS